MNIKIILSLISVSLMGSLVFADHDVYHDHKNHDHGKDHMHQHVELKNPWKISLLFQARMRLLSKWMAWSVHSVLMEQKKTYQK